MRITIKNNKESYNMDLHKFDTETNGLPVKIDDEFYKKYVTDKIAREIRKAIKSNAFYAKLVENRMLYISSRRLPDEDAEKPASEELYETIQNATNDKLEKRVTNFNISAIEMLKNTEFKYCLGMYPTQEFNNETHKFGNRYESYFPVTKTITVCPRNIMRTSYDVHAIAHELSHAIDDLKNINSGSDVRLFLNGFYTFDRIDNLSHIIDALKSAALLQSKDFSLHYNIDKSIVQKDNSTVLEYNNYSLFREYLAFFIEGVSRCMNQSKTIMDFKYLFNKAIEDNLKGKKFSRKTELFSYFVYLKAVESYRSLFSKNEYISAAIKLVTKKKDHILDQWAQDVRKMPFDISDDTIDYTDKALDAMFNTELRDYNYEAEDTRFSREIADEIVEKRKNHILAEVCNNITIASRANVDINDILDRFGTGEYRSLLMERTFVKPKKSKIYEYALSRAHAVFVTNTDSFLSRQRSLLQEKNNQLKDLQNGPGALYTKSQLKNDIKKIEHQIEEKNHMLENLENDNEREEYIYNAGKRSRAIAKNVFETIIDEWAE